MSRAPCLGCTERHTACHSECEKYKAYHSERETELKARKRESMYHNYAVETAERVKKQTRRRKK